jgi:hypothetical protein
MSAGALNKQRTTHRARDCYNSQWHGKLWQLSCDSEASIKDDWAYKRLQPVPAVRATKARDLLAMLAGEKEPPADFGDHQLLLQARARLSSVGSCYLGR